MTEVNISSLSPERMLPLMPKHVSNIYVICYIILFTSTKPCTKWFQYEDSILRHDNITVCNLIPKTGSKGPRTKTSETISWTLPPITWDVVTHWCSSETQKILTLKYTITKTIKFTKLNIFLTCLYVKHNFIVQNIFFNTTVDRKALIMKLLFACAV